MKKRLKRLPSAGFRPSAIDLELTLSETEFRREFLQEVGNKKWAPQLDCPELLDGLRELCNDYVVNELTDMEGPSNANIGSTYELLLKPAIELRTLLPQIDEVSEMLIDDASTSIATTGGGSSPIDDLYRGLHAFISVTEQAKRSLNSRAPSQRKFAPIVLAIGLVDLLDRFDIQATQSRDGPAFILFGFVQNVSGGTVTEDPHYWLKQALLIRNRA